MATSGPTSIGPYRLEALLGRGGMGVVHRAVDTRTGTSVALKLLLPELARSPEVTQRFLREGRLGLAVRHENVVATLDAGEASGTLYLALELVTGGSLRDRLARTGPLPWREAARLGAQIARGLGAIHAAGLVHRDVKPANVLETGSGRVKVSDLGLGRRGEAGGASRDLTRTGEVLGTGEYLAPEQADGSKEVGPAADLYALGATLHELLTGRPPFAGHGIELLKHHLLTVPSAPGARVAGIPPALDALVLRLLAKEPGARGASADAVARELDAIAAGKGETRPSRGPAPFALAAVLAVAGGAALLVRGAPGPGPAEPSSRATPRASPSPSLRPPPKPTGSPIPDWVARWKAEGRDVPDALPPSLRWSEVEGEYAASVDGSVLVFVRGRRVAYGPGPADARPSLTVRDFFLGKYEVTNAQFERFDEAQRARDPAWRTLAESEGLGGHALHVTEAARAGLITTTPRIAGASWRNPAGQLRGAADPTHPVVQITWEEASAYTAWAKLRLPSEAEWELAARGPDDRLYPWGNDPPGSSGPARANLPDARYLATVDETLREAVERFPGYDDGYERTAPVGSFPDGRAPCGALDLSGNVAEWCLDLYRADPRTAKRGRYQEVVGEPTGEAERVYRGGSWNEVANAAHRTHIGTRRVDAVELRPLCYDDLGLRVAVSSEPEGR